MNQPRSRRCNLFLFEEVISKEGYFGKITTVLSFGTGRLPKREKVRKPACAKKITSWIRAIVFKGCNPPKKLAGFFIGMPTKLILIRHGQTDWNLNKRYSGYLDVSINQNGKAQARKLCRRLKEENVHRIYASDRKRAIQTARIIFQKEKIVQLADLREVHFGIFEGLTYKEIIKKYPVIYRKWVKDAFRTAIPEGESLNKFKKRVLKAIKKIISLNKNKTVAVVSHGGVISIFLNSIKKTKEFWAQIPGSASLSIVECENSRAKIKSFNDMDHLLGLEKSL